jgi:streptogramin lyase
LWEFTGHTENVTGIAVNSSDPVDIFTCSWDSTVRKLTEYGVEVWSKTLEGNLTSIVVDQDNNLYVSSSSDKLFKLNSLGNIVWEFTGHTGNVNDVAVDVNGNVYTASNDGTIRKLNSNGNQVWKFEDNDMENFYAIAVDKDGYVFAGSQTTDVYKLNLSGGLAWKFTGHTAPVISIAVDYSNNVYSTGFDDKVYKLNSDGDELWNYVLSDYGVVSVDINDNVYVALNSGNVVRLTAAGALLYERSVSSSRLGTVASSSLVGAFPDEWIP